MCIRDSGEGDQKGIDELEQRLLEQNKDHMDWECTEEMMKLTKDGKALYMHCLPADITGVSAEHGEVAESVFDRYRVPLYKEASFKPYIIAAMILLQKIENPEEKLRELVDKANKRLDLSLIHISEPTRLSLVSRMPSSA